MGDTVFIIIDGNDIPTSPNKGLPSFAPDTEGFDVCFIVRRFDVCFIVPSCSDLPDDVDSHYKGTSFYEAVKRQLIVPFRRYRTDDMDSDYKERSSFEGLPRRISGLHSVDRGHRSNPTLLRMEHSALNGSKSKWKIEVKCRPKGDNAANWQDILVHYPGAVTEIDHNHVNLSIPWPNEEDEFAVFGTPEIGDKKRMQLGIFSDNPAKGQNTLFHAVLFDDTLMAFKNVCSKEESEGRQLLTTLGGMFVSISEEDIKIEVSGLESGFELKGSDVKTIKSKEAWNTPENSTDFPFCVFEITCVNEMKQSVSCEINATHVRDSTNIMVVTPLQPENEVPFSG